MASHKELDEISFSINGERYNVNPTRLNPDLRLVDFIRDEAGLKGTKYMCREGGCGACVVSVKSKDAVNGQETVKAVNSCLTPILSCDGWNIATVESLGSRKKGLHPIQKRLVHFGGSQCGFCTSGMVMSMHSLLESNKQPDSNEVERILDGNICRCTGYRPILDAFKSLSVDASEHIRNQCLDIEDCRSSCPCPFDCKEKCTKNSVGSSYFEFPTGEQWIQSNSLEDILNSLQTFQKTLKKYKLVAGNTGSGVYKNDGPFQAYVDLSKVSDLKKWRIDATGITIGGGISLSETIEILKNASGQDGLSFASQMADHIERVANAPVRNRATVAGNLMLKHAHKEFPSDVFLILETVATKIRIASVDDTPKMYTLVEFLNLDMYGKVILSICIPQRKNGHVFRSFKISRRYQNAHAYINGGFLFKIDRTSGFKVVEKPRIVFGGISNSFVHASATESYLQDKNLADESVLKGALDVLEKELRPEIRVLEGTPEYRKLLAKSLLYKAVLDIVNEKIEDKYKSGGKVIERFVSRGKPEFETDKNNMELHGPVRKLEGPAQSTGEAEYVNDIPSRPGELFGAYVLSSVGNATLKKIDASEALKISGVVAFVQASDIPNPKGNNSMSIGIFPPTFVEPIFADNTISYAGQALGLILAESKDVAFLAARRVKVLYENVKPPILDIKDALKKAEKDGTVANQIFGAFTSVPNENDTDNEGGHDHKWNREIKGEFKIGGQAHFHMETQSCICIPVEDGMDVFSGTQWMDHTQGVIASALGIPTNMINMKVRRIGGAFGAKLTRASGVAAACAVAAYVTNRPVRLILDMETNMAMIGKRPPYFTRYEVGFDDEGRIGKLKAEIFCDVGYSCNEPDAAVVPNYIQNVYRAVNWEIKPGFLFTNTPANTFTRAPGSVDAVAVIENIMEHIAHALQKDPLEVRLNNMAKPSDLVFPKPIKLGEENLAVKLIDEISRSGNFKNRKQLVEQFNSTNRWKKRGIALVPVRYFVDFYACKFPIFVTINRIDGYVSVSHGGIEMGNGVNTKVAQVVSFALGIPLNKIVIKPSNNLTGNNASFSGASITSELCCDGALKACKILVERMQPIKNFMQDPSWEGLVQECYNKHLDLSATYMHGPNDGIAEYNTFLVNITEVEIDVLTGEYKVVRVDLLEDTGKSINPSVDIGQIEGAYIMGQGLWTTEKLLYEESTGKLLTDRTWTYKVPESKDIPEDFRVKLFSSAPNLSPKGVLGSKATGEPPLCSSVCVLFALKNAINSARRDAGNTEWFEIEAPITPEDILRYSLTSSDNFSY